MSTTPLTADPVADYYETYFAEYEQQQEELEAAAEAGSKKLTPIASQFFAKVQSQVNQAYAENQDALEQTRAIIQSKFALHKTDLPKYIQAQKQGNKEQIRALADSIYNRITETKEALDDQYIMYQSDAATVYTNEFPQDATSTPLMKLSVDSTEPVASQETAVPAAPLTADPVDDYYETYFAEFDQQQEELEAAAEAGSKDLTPIASKFFAKIQRQVNKAYTENSDTLEQTRAFIQSEYALHKTDVAKYIQAQKQGKEEKIRSLADSIYNRITETNEMLASQYQQYQSDAATAYTNEFPQDATLNLNLIEENDDDHWAALSLNEELPANEWATTYFTATEEDNHFATIFKCGIAKTAAQWSDLECDQSISFWEDGVDSMCNDDGFCMTALCFKAANCFQSQELLA